MDIKRRIYDVLTDWAKVGTSTITFDVGTARRVLEDARAEIERLESELTKEIASHTATLELWGKVAGQYKAQKK